MPDRIVKKPTDARGGSIENVVRYILVISIALVVVLFIGSYIIS